jgi:hypothetical protein
VVVLIRGDACVGPNIEVGGAVVTMGEAYCEGGCSRDAWGGPPSMEEMDMLLPLLAGRPSGGRVGSSRPEGKVVGGPTETGGALGGGGPYA